MLHRIIIPGAAIALCAGMAQASLVDDFSGDRLDFSKYRSFASEGMHEKIRDIDSGELLLYVASDGKSAESTGIAGSRLPLADQDDLRTLSATARVVEVTPGGTATAPAQGNQGAYLSLGGTYYNDGQSATVGDATGDVFAAILLGDWGNGLEARYRILTSTNADFTAWDIHAEDSIITGLSTGTDYTLEIDYDGSNGFTFSIDGNPESDTGPARADASTFVFRGQRLAAIGEPGDSAVAIRSRFDDVMVGGALYDAFGDSRIQKNLWRRYEIRRHVQDGKLRLDIGARNLGDSLGPRSRVIYPENPDYAEAKFAVSSGSTLDNNVFANPSLAGVVYNESRDGGTEAAAYNGWEDNVFAQVYLSDSSGTVGAGAFLCALDQSGNNCKSGKTYVNQAFDVQLERDTEYRLWIERRDAKLILGIGDMDTIEHDITTGTFSPSPDALDGYRELRNRIGGGDASADGGVARSTVDDFRTSRATSDGGGGGSGGSDGDGGGSSGSDDSTTTSDDGGGGGGAFGGLLIGLGAVAALRRRRQR